MLVVVLVVLAVLAVLGVLGVLVVVTSSTPLSYDQLGLLWGRFQYRIHVFVWVLLFDTDATCFNVLFQRAFSNVLDGSGTRNTILKKRSRTCLRR